MTDPEARAQARSIIARRILCDLARAGLLWTGDQHDAMATPPHPVVAGRLVAAKRETT